MCGSQRRDPRWSDGDGAVPGGLGDGVGELLQHRCDAFRWAGQRVSGHQPAAPDQEETWRVRGNRPAGGAQVHTRCLLLPFLLFIILGCFVPAPVLIVYRVFSCV